MQNACKEFLRILQDAEKWGSRLNVEQVGKKLSRLPTGASSLDVFNECKRQGWLLGSAWGPWLTDAGKKHADPN
jgi:hypothetical protein